MKTGRIGLVVNPTAGGGTAKEVGAQFARVATERGLRVVGLSALSAEVALENVQRELHAIDALVVVGGDGMVHLGIQALAQTEVPLGLIPVGTGNDFAATTRIPKDPDAVIEDLVRRLVDDVPPRSVDLLHVDGDGVEGGERWVAGAVSAGLDAAVNERANRMRFPRGAAKYVVSAVREILSYRSWGYQLTIEGVQLTPPQRVELEDYPGLLISAADDTGRHTITWDSRGALVTAANGSTIGGGIRVAPNALVDDGMLELILARDVGALTAARLFPMMIAGVHLRSKELRAISARSVRIESPDSEGQWPSVYGDGERVGTLPVRVEVVPGALRLLA